MKPIYYVKRCKHKTGNERYKTLHAADNYTTFCGKPLDEMWYIEPDADLTPEDVDCIECRKVIHNG